MDSASQHLGEFTGLCACYKKPTMNGRNYNKIFASILAGEDYRFNEMMRRGGILCEFGHPSQYTADFERTETDPEKAAAIINEIYEGDDGKIFAKGVILDTPAGRTYKAISPFYKFGFSSRGSYEADEAASEGPDGWNQDSYVFKGFDIVALPANEGSEISATEGVTSKSRKKKMKTARESLDLNNIADANNIDKKEVEAELDKLFNEDGNLEPVELIDSREFTEANERDNKGETKTTSNTLLLDLHKVLNEKGDLEKQVQKLLFEKAESDAAIISLQTQIKQLAQMQDEAKSKITSYEANKEEIKQLLEKLTGSYDAYTDATDRDIQEQEQNLISAKEKSNSLASQVASLTTQLESAEDTLESTKLELKKANESLSSLTSASSKIKATNESLQKSLEEQLKKTQSAEEGLGQATSALELYKTKYTKMAAEAKSAKESLVEAYSSIYSISAKSLVSKVGAQPLTVANIKRAAEELSNDTVRLASYSQQVPATESVEIKEQSYDDESEEELFTALKQEGYIGGNK